MDLTVVTTIVALSVPFFVGTVWAIVNVLQKDFGSMGAKTVWALVAMIPFIGFIIYLIFGFRRGTKQDL